MKYLNKEYNILAKLQKRDEALHRQHTTPRGKRNRGGRGSCWFNGMAGPYPLRVYNRMRRPTAHDDIANVIWKMYRRRRIASSGGRYLKMTGAPGDRIAAELFRHCKSDY